MNLETLGNRIRNRISSPPEIVYALTRHWLAVAILALVGSSAMVTHVILAPPMYEGWARLGLDVGSSSVVDQVADKGTDREDTRRLFTASVEMLKGDSVFRDVVRLIQSANVTSQEEERKSDEDRGAFRAFLGKIKQEVKALKQRIEHRSAIDAGEEHQTQLAIESLQRRSSVVPNVQAGSFLIKLKGTDRDLLAKELDQWIDSYRNRLVVVAKESRDLFLQSRTQHWQDLEKTAFDKIQEFKAAHPEVTSANQDLLVKEVTELQALKLRLQTQIDLGQEPATPAPERGPLEEEEEVARLRRQLHDLEGQRITLLPAFGPNSDRIRRLEESIGLIEARTKAAEQAAREAHGRQPEERPSPSRTTQLASISAALDDAMERMQSLQLRLDELAVFQDEHARYKQTRKAYELMNLERMDWLELGKISQVQILDGPEVPTTPQDIKPYTRILAGFGAGLVLGILFALLSELLRGKVRFKSDVEGELEIAVVGVFPKR